MYKRKIEEQLLAWKNKTNHKPLVLRGVRQCGKSSSVRKFAQEHYKYQVFIDFREQEDLISLFDNGLTVDYLTTIISAAIPEAIFVPNQTCLILDEIQDCPRARGALKFFRQDGRYDVICTGSLLGVSGYKNPQQQLREKHSSIPVGQEEFLDMYPMDFEEFLWACGIKESTITLLREHMDQLQPIPQALHTILRQRLLEYTVVGGMPEAVTTFLTTHDINQTLAIQKAIVDGYKSDMIHYARQEDQPCIRQCFESIPVQLSKENKKFQYSVVRHGGRSKDFAGSLQWIEDAGIVNRCYNLHITELPLDGNANPDVFKVYMSDTGLFVSMLDQGTQADILRGNLLSYKGAIFENLMADILGKMGRKLYYFHKDSGLELDFLVRYKGQCTPIECKATTGNAQSLRTVMNHPEKYHVSQAIKVGDYNIGFANGVLTLPFYLGFLLVDY